MKATITIKMKNINLFLHSKEKLKKQEKKKNLVFFIAPTRLLFFLITLLIFSLFIGFIFSKPLFFYLKKKKESYLKSNTMISIKTASNPGNATSNQKISLYEKPESLPEKTSFSPLLTHYTMKAYMEYHGNRWCIIEDENQKLNLFTEGDKLNQTVVGVIMPDHLILIDHEQKYRLPLKELTTFSTQIDNSLSDTATPG